MCLNGTFSPRTLFISFRLTDQNSLKSPEEMMNIMLWLFCIKYKNNYTVISMHRSHYNTLGVCVGGGGEKFVFIV